MIALWFLFFSDSYEQWHFPSRCELSWVCVLLTPRHEFRCQGSEINAHVRLNFLGPRCYMYIRECVPPACFTMKTQVIETAQFRTTRCHVYISVCARGCSLPPDYFPSGFFCVYVCVWMCACVLHLLTSEKQCVCVCVCVYFELCMTCTRLPARNRVNFKCVCVCV